MEVQEHLLPLVAQEEVRAGAEVLEETGAEVEAQGEGQAGVREEAEAHEEAEVQGAEAEAHINTGSHHHVKCWECLGFIQALISVMLRTSSPGMKGMTMWI